jgi:hypothetical protein
MTPEERFRHHQEHTTPIMDRLKVWMDSQIEERKVRFAEASPWGTHRSPQRTP